MGVVMGKFHSLQRTLRKMKYLMRILSPLNDSNERKYMTIQ
jgi:hypothetical protein